VLECVSALDQLHTTLTHELDRRRQLESEVRDAKAGERRARRMALHDTDLAAEPQLLSPVAGPRTRPRHAATAAVRGAVPDLDGFKAINDAHGHRTGDDVLRIVAMRLARAVRGEDVVNRLGGDEFACLLAELSSREQLSQLACKLLDAVSVPVSIGDLELSVRPSIGIATWPADETSPEALLDSADAAMYHAKREKSGGFFNERAERRVPPTGI
jgi:diguanylate cyclase (GGDEF)-like protein